MVKIILNADDFGRSKERNQAVDDAFKQGLIRSAGLIVTGKNLQNAVDYINHGDYVNHIHLHVNLSTSLKGEDPEDVPLTESMRKDSFFCKNGKFAEHKGLQHGFRHVFKWRLVYKEMVAQYNKFIEITNGKGDYEHIDFHLWYNLIWPVSVALNVFTRKYKIKSVRYMGLHQKKSKHGAIYRIVSWNPRVKSYPSTNIDYYLTKHHSFNNEQIVELYSHPNYKDGVFLDDSPSYLKHERQTMPKQIQMLRELENIEFVSWEDNL